MSDALQTIQNGRMYTSAVSLHIFRYAQTRCEFSIAVRQYAAPKGVVTPNQSVWFSGGWHQACGQTTLGRGDKGGHEPETGVD